MNPINPFRVCRRRIHQKLAEKLLSFDTRKAKMTVLSKQKLCAPALLIFSLQVMLGFASNAATYREIESAVRSENLVQIQSMIKTDGGIQSDTGARCLMVAALWDKQAIMEKLLADGVSVNASPIHANEAGETPLTYAIFGAHDDIVAFLLKQGANPNYRGDCQSRDCSGLMPLDLAVKSGLFDITRRLLDAGADPNAGRNFAVEFANQQGELKIFQLLTAHHGHLANVVAEPAGSIVFQPHGASVADNRSISALGLAELLPSPSSGSPALQGNGKRCRLAVIADDANLAAADVLVSRLSAQPSLELIERQELDRLFAEKQLTRDFASRDANYTSVASILRADALLLIRTRDLDGRRIVEARFIRVHPGIVLDTVYRAAPLMDVEAWVDEMNGHVTNLAAKVGQVDGVAVSVLDFHSALPTPATTGFEHTLSVLLRDRLVHNPRFIVLERAEMEKVAFENAGEKPFWAGSYLVDPVAETALNNSDTFTLTAHLQPAGKGTAITATVSGNRSNPAQAIDALIQSVNAQMGGNEITASRPEPVIEAKNYFNEAQWALAARMPTRAEAAAEVAWALGLQTLDVAKLRVLTAEDSIRDETRRKSSSTDPSEPLDLAIQAVGIWDDILQGGLIRDNPDQLRPWLESISNLTEVVTLAITSVKTSTSQMDQAQRLETLRKIYWAALNDAWTRSHDLPSNAGVLEKFTATQFANAQLMLPDGDELKAALKDLLSRHVPADDTATRARLRLSLHWRVCKVPLLHASGSREIKYWLPENDSVRKWLFDYLRQSSEPEDNFIVSAIDFEGPVILPPEHSVTLMEDFWDMRDFLAQNPELFKPYFERLKGLIENEPMGRTESETKYVPRTYQVTLKLEGDAEKKPREMTQFEYYAQLALYLINHTSRAEPELIDLATRYAYRYSPEVKAQLQEACARYAENTGAPHATFSQKEPIRRETVAANGLPPLKARRFWHPFDLGLNIAPEFQWNTMQWHEDRLWVLGHAQQYDEPRVHHYLFSIDLPSMHTETVELTAGPPGDKPYEHGSWLPSFSDFVLTPRQVLLTVAGDFFGIYDRSARKWELFRDLKPGSAPVLKQGSAYFIVEDSTAVVGFDLQNHATRLLVSTRRKPAESPLDNPNYLLKNIWTNGAGEIVVSAQNNAPPSKSPGMIDGQSGPEYLVAVWSLERNDWRVLKGWTNAPPRDRGELVGAGSVQRMNLGGSGAGLASVRPQANANWGDTWLALRLKDPNAPLKSIPLELALADYANLPWGRFGKPALNINLSAVCFRCPQGYIIPPSSSPGFWFIPREELNEYVNAVGQPKQLARP
jgi:hypothetical protein